MIKNRKSFVDNINARLVLTVLIAKPGEKPIKVKGESSSFVIRSDLPNVKKKALQNAIFKYLAIKDDVPEDIYNSGNYIRNNAGNVKIQILDYNVTYYDYRYLKLKREKRRGKYYNVLRSTKTGQFVSISKWKNTKTKEFISEEQVEDLGLENEEM